jgi:hypothetical protein
MTRLSGVCVLIRHENRRHRQAGDVARAAERRSSTHSGLSSGARPDLDVERGDVSPGASGIACSTPGAEPRISRSFSFCAAPGCQQRVTESVSEVQADGAQPEDSSPANAPECAHCRQCQSDAGIPELPAERAPESPFRARPGTASLPARPQDHRPSPPPSRLSRNPRPPVLLRLAALRGWRLQMRVLAAPCRQRRRLGRDRVVPRQSRALAPPQVSLLLVILPLLLLLLLLSLVSLEKQRRRRRVRASRGV